MDVSTDGEYVHGRGKVFQPWEKSGGIDATDLQVGCERIQVAVTGVHIREKHGTDHDTLVLDYYTVVHDNFARGHGAFTVGADDFAGVQFGC